MIKITPIASSSKGNCYHVTDGTTALILDAGVPFKQIQQKLLFRTSDIVACLVTHEHIDHVRHLEDYTKRGIDCYMSKGTEFKLPFMSHRTIVCESFVDFTIGTWVVIPFDVNHDASEPLGYVLINKLGETLLFATDTYYIKYKFNNITHLLIECNYSIDIVKSKINITTEKNKKEELEHRYKRLLESHMSLETLKEYLHENDISNLKEVHLIHLSDTNSDESLFKTEVQKITGCPVYVAGK